MKFFTPGNVAGRQIDQAVEETFLQRMTPEELSLTLVVEQEALVQADVLNKKWRLRIEQATYEVRLCAGSRSWTFRPT